MPINPPWHPITCHSSATFKSAGRPTMKLDDLAWQIIDGILTLSLRQVEFLKTRKDCAASSISPWTLSCLGTVAAILLLFPCVGATNYGAPLFLNRSNVQVLDRFNPFVGFFDFSDHTKLVQLIEALRSLALGQILTSADTDIITLSIGFYVF